MRRMGYMAAADRVKDALALTPKILAHPALSKPKERRVMSLAGDLHWLDGNAGTAATWYTRANKGAAGAFGRRVLYLKRWALTQPAAVRRPVMSYLVGKPGEPREGARDVHLAYQLQAGLGRRATPSGLGLYLVGKQLSARGLCEDAVEPLQKALGLGLPTVDFVTEARRTLARCQYIESDFAGARATLRRLLGRADLPAGVRLEARDWQQRIMWRTTGRLPAVAIPLLTPLKPPSKSPPAKGSRG